LPELTEGIVWGIGGETRAQPGDAGNSVLERFAPRLQGEGNESTVHFPFAALEARKKEKLELLLSPTSALHQRSVQAEVYFNIDLHCDRLSVFHRRLKFPVAHRLDGLLV
jgi:hypothetical protein